jgi:hypothetical protein
MPSPFRKLLCAGFVCLTCACTVRAQKAEAAKATNEAVTSAQTTTYCEVQQDPERFKNRMIRVRALYETDFEVSIITAPSCHTPVPMTWVTFDKQWESRSTRRVRHALSRLNWRVQADVVFIGLFKSDGRYGHMDMYPFSIEVYRVEAVCDSGSFRPVPDQDATQH